MRREGVPTLKSLETQGQLQLHYNTERKNFKTLNEQQKEVGKKIAEYQGK